MVLISLSVVLLSFLFSWEWIFIFRSDFWFSSWFVVSIRHHGSWIWLLGNQSDQGSRPLETTMALPRPVVGPGFPSRLRQRCCPCSGSSAVTPHVLSHTLHPPRRVSSLSFCYLCNASKECFGNI